MKECQTLETDLVKLCTIHYRDSATKVLEFFVGFFQFRLRRRTRGDALIELNTADVAAAEFSPLRYAAARGLRGPVPRGRHGALREREGGDRRRAPGDRRELPRRRRGLPALLRQGTHAARALRERRGGPHDRDCRDSRRLSGSLQSQWPA